MRRGGREADWGGPLTKKIARKEMNRPKPMRLRNARSQAAVAAAAVDE